MSCTVPAIEWSTWWLFLPYSVGGRLLNWGCCQYQPLHRLLLLFYKKLMYHAACEVEQSWSWVSTIQTVEKRRCEYDRLKGWNSTLQAAWYIRHVRMIWFLWTKPTIWLLILSFTQNIVRACSMFYPCEGYSSVTPLDAARVNRTIFHNHSVHWYYITLMKGNYYMKHDIDVRHGKQNPRRGRWLQ